MLHDDLDGSRDPTAGVQPIGFEISFLFMFERSKLSMISL